jgi:uncharacterized protein involved in cysteine biosynthesis
MKMNQQMSWMQVITVIVTNLAGILLALAVLIAVVTRQFSAIRSIMNGHVGQILEAFAATARTEGKIDALIQAPPSVIKETKVVSDRRETADDRRKSEES